MLDFMYAFPVFVASLGSYDRIQKYLLTGENQKQSAPLTGISKPEQRLEQVGHAKGVIPDVEAVQLDELDYAHLSKHSKSLVLMENASFSFAPTKEPVLKNFSLKIMRGTSSLLVGPVGSGKTVVAKFFDSFRNVIIGPSNFDEIWYREVINACCLDTDISLLPQQDTTTVGSKGVSLSGGQRQRIALARAIYSRKHLLLLDDITSGLDNTTESQVLERILGRDGICRRYGLTVVLATHKIKFKLLADTVIKIDPEGSTVKVQCSDRISSSPGGDFQVEQDLTSIVPGLTTLEEEGTGNVNELSDLSRRVGDFSLYVLYAKEMRLCHIILFVFASIGFCFFSSFPNIWLEWWSEEQIEYPGHSSTRYIAGYAGFGVSSTVCFFLVYWIFMVESVPHTSVRLHRRLLNIVTAAPLSNLVSIDTGVLLNHFTQDLSLLDMRLPGAMIQVLDGALDAIAEFVLIAESSPWTALTFPPLFLILYALQKFYLNTSRQIRYLDLEAKSPLLSSFLETCEGISTIRGFGWQGNFRQRNMHLTHESQKPFYLMYSIQFWLTLMLNLLVMGIVVVLVTVAVQLRGTSGGALGVALNNVSAISSTLTYVIQAWTSLETSMGALARLKSFEAETPSEHLPRECNIPASPWPSEERIEFVDVSLSYRADMDPVVRGINLTISPGTKIGICGRSGSGESSLSLGLLRLNNITKGRILVEDLDISQIPRETIRQNIAALPQDPLILPGSIRTNIDPLKAHDDQQIISTICRVGLSNWFSPQESGLDSVINQETLSAGQQQLITFARILLKPNASSIRLFDEVTSMVDVETEATMMRLIREEFEGCTVIAVAHRLKTILDFDQVLVMDDGVFVESGNPAELLQDSESWFSRLCIKQDSA
ncbi:ABC transporter integral membrane type 1 [Penicillium malachiteum]|uniref:ABC transporter integral membrane type 1 n=1 Tax=Penicillium malachiteum TaxID=1324776 RepID=A0AAD6MZL4_9EURO|nr:ABC transporter integral membrane type 1 [Penicillium malachiteum]